MRPARTTIVPGRSARTLAEAWGLSPAQVEAEHERLKRFRNVAPPPKQPADKQMERA